MDAVNGLLTGFSVILTAQNLYLCFLGSVIGTLVGVLPGVGPLAALALLLPVTFTMQPVGGMVMLASIFYGAMYGGSTTSILLNIPGEAASVVTCLDGHKMARQGRAGAALGIAAIGSFVAGTLGVIIMTFFAPAIAAIAIRFGPPENFGLMVLGLVCTLYMITGSPVKGVLMIALGFLCAAIGIDVVNGRERFTFGSVDLSAGIELLAVVIGLFGVSEVLSNVETMAKSTLVSEKIRGPHSMTGVNPGSRCCAAAVLDLFSDSYPAAARSRLPSCRMRWSGGFRGRQNVLARARSRAWRDRNPPTMRRLRAVSFRFSRSAFRAIR
jgi:putative tricarboxylic transport membrane protein